jgi:predicted dehydrogenase
MATERVRIGIIGAGQIGTAHLHHYREIADAEVVAVADLFPDRIERARASFGVADGYEDFQDLLARDDVQAVDVCVHNNKHAPLAMAALRAGKHVFCEKPMAGSYRDAADMLETARDCGRMLSVQLATLFRMETRAAKSLIDDGRLGHLYHARSVGFRRRGRPFVDGYGTANFVHAPICAGGALFDMGVYHIANILYLLGNPGIRTVSGTVHQQVGMYGDRRAFADYGVEELGLGLARLENGVSFAIEEAWAAHNGGGESSKILGSEGGVSLDPFRFFTTVCDMPMDGVFDLKGTHTRWTSCFPETDAYDSAQQHWIAALKGRVPLLPTAEIALSTALISEGIYQSSRAERELTREEIVQRSESLAIDPYTPEKVWA